jgi:hypothetical protein
MTHELIFGLKGLNKSQPLRKAFKFTVYSNIIFSESKQEISERRILRNRLIGPFKTGFNANAQRRVQKFPFSISFSQP